jgi:small subunit ribosomal protein S6
MDQLSRVYEAMFLVDSGDTAVWDDLVKHLAGLLTRSGAEIIGLTRWDERKLAYPVAKRKRGTYVLAFFLLRSGGAPVAEIERDCLLSEKVLRVLILKADHFTVAAMRLQLGEDIREDVAKRLREERGEPEALAVVAAAKPTHTSDAEAGAAPAEDGPAEAEPRTERRRRGADRHE